MINGYYPSKDLQYSTTGYKSYPPPDLLLALADRLCDRGALDQRSLSLADAGPFEALGVDVEALGSSRRPLTRSCLDWSERRPHLAGELGAATLRALFDSKWLARRPQGRAIAVTPRGREGLRDVLGIDAG